MYVWMNGWMDGGVTALIACWCRLLFYMSSFILNRSPQERQKTKTTVDGDNVAPCKTQTGSI